MADKGKKHLPGLRQIRYSKVMTVYNRTVKRGQLRHEEGTALQGTKTKYQTRQTMTTQGLNHADTHERWVRARHRRDPGQTAPRRTFADTLQALPPTSIHKPQLRIRSATRQETLGPLRRCIRQPQRFTHSHTHTQTHTNCDVRRLHCVERSTPNKHRHP